MARNAIEQQAFNQLESIRTIKKSELLGYISSLKSTLLILNNDPYAAIALKEFTTATSNGGINGNAWQKVEQEHASHFKKHQ